MKRIVSSIAAVATGLWLVSASALGLGEIDVRSHLNQRFDAVIPLNSIGADEAANLRVSVAGNEDFTRAGIERADYLSSLRFAVRTDGTPRIEISSEKIEREPYLQLLLEVRGNGNRILRQYTVLLDPPGMVQNTPAPVAVPAPAPKPAAKPTPAQQGDSGWVNPIFVEVEHPQPPPDEKPVAPRSEPVKAAPAPVVAASTSTAEAPIDTSHDADAGDVASAAPVGGELYGPVKAGETLWSLATRVRGDHADVTMDQALLALYKSNPRAFDGGINGLVRGAMLRVPSVEDMRAIDAVSAHSEVARLRGLRAPAATNPGTPRASKPVIEPAQIKPPPPPAASADRAEAVAKAPVAETQPAAPKAEVADKAEAPATTAPPEESQPAAATPESETPPAPASTTDNGEAAPETAAADGSEGDAAAPPPPAPEPQAKPEPKPVAAKPKKASGDGLFETLLIPLVVGLLLLFAIAWLFARWRARRAPPAPPPAAAAATTAPKRMPLSALSASEAAVAAATAAAAAKTQKLTPQQELDRLQASIEGRETDKGATQQLRTQQVDDEAAQATAETPLPPAEDLPPVDFDLTGQFAAQTVQIDLDANDPVSEADFHLAYGLYDEAALLLRQAAEKEPQRTDIGMKLAETYFAAGKTAEFTQTATELKPKLSPADWQKLAIMGQQLDPSSTQFSEAAQAPMQTDLDPGFAFDASPAAPAAPPPEDSHALDFNFDSEPPASPAPGNAPEPTLKADNGLDFKLDDLELPSLDVAKHDAPPAAPKAAEDDNALEFDLGSFDVAAEPKAEAPPPPAAAKAGDTAALDFDFGDFDAEAPADAAAPTTAAPAAETPIEEFDFDAVSTEAGDVAGDESATKLDLARAYIEMGDNEMARSLLDEVLAQGNAQQKQDAQALVERLA